MYKSLCLTIKDSMALQKQKKLNDRELAIPSNPK